MGTKSVKEKCEAGLGLCPDQSSSLQSSCMGRGNGHKLKHVKFHLNI